MDNTHLPSWTVETQRIGREPESYAFEATQAECEAVARYLNVLAVIRLHLPVKLTPLAAGRFQAIGRVSATLRQLSVVSLEPVENEIEEDFSLQFWPSGTIPQKRPEDSDEGISFQVDADTPEPVTDGKIEFGRLACELVSIAMDAYPRKPGEEFEYEDRSGESDASPFAALQRLKK